MTMNNISNSGGLNLKTYTPKTVLIHAGISIVLNGKSQSNTENLLSNIKSMVVRLQICCEKYVNIWFWLHNNRIVRSIEKNP